jgi:hypothetical protein
MKQFLILLTATLLMGCSVKHIYTATSQVLDYEKYSKQGFFITESNSVSFDYTPIGSVVVRVFSGYVNEGTEYVKKFKSNGTYTENPTIRAGEWKDCDLNDAFTQLYKEAISKGANGVINLKYEFSPSFSDYTPDRWIITGQLIRK